MKRLVALVTLVVFMLSCSFITPLPPKLPELQTLHLTSNIIQHMQEIQREYENETARCLEGYVQGATLVVTDIRHSWISASSPISTTFHPCEEPEDVGYYHNHPGKGYVGDEDAFCGFSILDMATFAQASKMHVAIISCNERTLVWMFKPGFRQFQWTGVPTEPER